MTLTLKVPDIACSACVSAVTDAIKSFDSSATVEADPKTKIVNVQTQQPEDKIKQVLANAGYPAA
ncbi:MAG: heavy-metal-associated domain-containing protein [Cyanobacteria bacterium J06639_18]|uniref:heavy-metal-associated domain-containing protein n=1 Tax=Mastigocoleus sp. MO_188.B34 TaxID=3036635 RepID=UPI00261E149C|nr:heavy-metal-associated domain-containing protein [Mastigocoleus sp. MO_188.B34]MDJ0697546.1 heavy-metal-associated domain-containing protein [Mastigocoleus sp. MO_188.B34]